MSLVTNKTTIITLSDLRVNDFMNEIIKNNLRVNPCLANMSVSIFYSFETGIVNPHPAKIINLNFQPLEVVSHFSDPQPQVVENYSHLFYKS